MILVKNIYYIVNWSFSVSLMLFSGVSTKENTMNLSEQSVDKELFSYKISKSNISKSILVNLTLTLSNNLYNILQFSVINNLLFSS